MILNRNDLNRYLSSDFSRYPHSNLPFILRWLAGDEHIKVRHYLWVLRHAEYAVNTHKLYNPLLRFWLRRLSYKYQLMIPLNTCGAGLKINHLGGGIFLNANRIGKNCTVTSGVVFGKKGEDDYNRPIIGDNVEVTLGAKVIGRVHIGDNTIVAPNSVVIKDVPENAVVSGVPAKIIKMN